jgi:hypothetical protein
MARLTAVAISLTLVLLHAGPATAQRFDVPTPGPVPGGLPGVRPPPVSPGGLPGNVPTMPSTAPTISPDLSHGLPAPAPVPVPAPVPQDGGTPADVKPPPPPPEEPLPDAGGADECPCFTTEETPILDSEGRVIGSTPQTKETGKSPACCPD